MTVAKLSRAGSLVSALLVTPQLLLAPVWGAADPGVERMATCQDSWLDWQKSDAAQLKNFGDHFRSAFSQNERDPFFVPKSATTIAGLRVLQVFPGSVGMGVGFSVLVDANFESARRSLETTLGKSLKTCGASDGMRTCELNFAEQRTFMLMAQDSAKSSTTLLGCYYYYEK